MELTKRQYEQLYNTLLDVQFMTMGQFVDVNNVIDPYFGQQVFDETAVIDWNNQHNDQGRKLMIETALTQLKAKYGIQVQTDDALTQQHWIYQANGKTLTYADVIMLFKYDQHHR